MTNIYDIPLDYTFEYFSLFITLPFVVISGDKNGDVGDGIRVSSSGASDC